MRRRANEHRHHQRTPPASPRSRPARRNAAQTVAAHVRLSGRGERLRRRVAVGGADPAGARRSSRSRGGPVVAQTGSKSIKGHRSHNRLHTDRGLSADRRRPAEPWRSDSRRGWTAGRRCTDGRTSPAIAGPAALGCTAGSPSDRKRPPAWVDPRPAFLTTAHPPVRVPHGGRRHAAGVALAGLQAHAECVCVSAMMSPSSEVARPAWR
jgi:hypothetical protein